MPFFSNPSFSVQYKTGYQPVARYNTVRAEFGVQLIELPIAIWVRDGYNSSLARNYKKDHAVGVELRFAE
jgi:hypothetical protein